MERVLKVGWVRGPPKVGVGRIDGVQNGGSAGISLGGKEEEAIHPFLLSLVEESY
jgi:hypothetical protein